MTPAEAADRNQQRYPGMVLQPCPFCASDFLYIYGNAPSSDLQTWPHVVCMGCGAGHTSVEKWNTRNGRVMES